jgi:hypothetical protein
MKGKFGIETAGLLGGKSESEPGEFRGSFWGMKGKFGIETVGLFGGNSQSKPWGYLGEIRNWNSAIFVRHILGYEGEIRNRNRGVIWGKFGVETVGLFGGNSESEY